jgi:hypothetical protein
MSLTTDRRLIPKENPMPFALEQMSQGLSVADVINQQSVNNASVASIGIDMTKFRRVLFVVQAGSLGAAGTLDGRLQSCAASNFGSGVHNIANSNFTQITQNLALATVECRDIDLTAGDRYLRLQLTGGGNAITVGAVGLGGEAEEKPAKANDLNTTYLTQRVIVG